MKILLTCLFMLLTNLAFASIEPDVDTRLEENKIIVNVSNLENIDLVCHYVVSWLEIDLNYKRYYGDIDLPASGEKKIIIDIQAKSKIFRIRTKVLCK